MSKYGNRNQLKKICKADEESCMGVGSYDILKEEAGVVGAISTSPKQLGL